MKAYVDSSVILRIVFGEKSALKLPKSITFYAANEILKIECFRTIERIKSTYPISDDEITERHAALHQIFRTLNIIKFSDTITRRACEPFPILLKSLNAIHLSTAILWSQQQAEEITFLTHDLQLGKAARSLGFSVLGV